MYQGTGLGLAIASKIAAALSGRLECASEGAGKGAAFSLLLPRKPPAARARAAAAAAVVSEGAVAIQLAPEVGLDSSTHGGFLLREQEDHNDNAGAGGVIREEGGGESTDGEGEGEGGPRGFEESVRGGAGGAGSRLAQLSVPAMLERRTSSYLQARPRNAALLHPWLVARLLRRDVPTLQPALPAMTE